MSTLQEIINSTESLEFKRAVAVKMVLSDFKTKDICDVLNVSDSFVSKWKIIYESEGGDGLKVNYKGGKGFLTEDQRYEIIFHIKNQPYYSVEELRDYIERHYGVVYESKQSYYDLLKEGGFSWHRTQAVNPKYDQAQVEQRREEIKAQLDERQDEIVRGEVVVFAEDEAHALWGDTLGYVWGRENERTEVTIVNAKERQTYYGAMNLYNQEFILSPYESGKGKNTVDFLKYLQAINKDKKLIILWDNATYHWSEEVRNHLDQVNHGLEKKDWKITCLPFAPYAPQQNPVEDVWLQGKNFLRRHFFENKTFNQVKCSFFNFLNKRIFNFQKPHWYLEIPQPA